MKKQYLVTALHRFLETEGAWQNVRSRTDGKRYYSTLEEAKAGLNAYLQKWNSSHEYNAKGERYENHGATTVIDKQGDYEMEVIAWKIRVREVTPWEEVEVKVNAEA